MNKRKVIITAMMFVIAVLLLAVTAFAADSTPVKVRLQNNQEISTTVGAVFTTTTTTSGYTITGIKAFGNYGVSSIKEIHIPYDATEVNITTRFANVESVIFDSYSKAKVTSLTGFSNLSTISIEGTSTVTFMASCSTSVKTINCNATSGTVTFSTNAFKDAMNLSSLVFKPGAKYSFGASSFQNTGLVSLDLVDDATFVFAGAGAFSYCAKLETVTTGNLVKTISNSPFSYCQSLKMVYIDGATAITDSSFTGTGLDKYQLKVYIHTSSAVSVGANAFTNRSAKGVVVCALQTDRTSFNSCTYQLHYGIQHAYTAASETPTCYNTYKTDCPCGKVRNAKYKLYESGKSVQDVELMSGANPDVPHTFTDVHTISYRNGFDQNGVMEAKCSVCGTLEGAERVAPALVVFPGYSVSEGNKKGIVIGIRFNSVTIAQYEKVTGQEIDFGVVLAAEKALNGKNPLNPNGGVVTSKVYKHDMSSLGHYDATIKLTGIKSTDLNTKFVMAGYMIVDGKVLYISNKGVSSSTESVSYSGLLMAK